MRRTITVGVLALTLTACTDTTEETATMSADSGSTPSATSPEALSANPFMAPSSLYLLAPAFDQIRDEHYLPAFEKGMQLHYEQVRAIADSPESPTFTNTIEALERSGAVLFRVSKVFFNLTESTTSERLQEIQAEIAPKLAQHSDGIYLDGPLFARVKTLYDQRDTLDLDPESARLLDRYHTMFIRAGAQLDDDAKTKLMALNEEQSKLTTQFQDNLLKDTNASAVLVDGVEALAGLDASAISSAAEAAKGMGHDGMYALTLQLPSSQGVLASLEDRELRKLVFEASTNRGDNDNEFDNKAIVRRLAQLRAERAALLGYPDHASFVLADQMAATPAAVNQMLGELAPQILSKAKAEATAMQAWIDEQGIELTLEPWDWAFYAEKLRKARYDLDEGQIRPYFEINRVIEDGMFMMARELYGISFQERTDLPVYHPDVRVYEVREDDGSTLGLFYVDYFARPSKRGGAWMDSFVDQAELLGTKAVVLNVMNIPKPAEGEPALLSFDEVNTLFHEFGHAAHGLFSQVRYPMLSGTNVPRDFVEFPSQFHEDFALDERVLASYARHHESGEPMPADLVAKIQAARHYGQGYASLEYIAAAMLDMRWHSLAPANADQSDVIGFEFAALKADGVAYMLIPPRYRSTYFAHIWPGGYSAGYYAYLWSEVLAADAFAHVYEKGGMTAENGQHFRDTILSKGLSKDPMQLYIDFRGEEPGIDALLVRRGLKE